MGREKTLTVGKDGFISIGGTNIISELLEGYENEKKTINSKHFFYILRMPPCGDNRIKIGKSANLYNRFRTYQSHMPSERIEIFELRDSEYEDEILEIYDLVISKSFDELDFQKLERRDPSTRKK